MSEIATKGMKVIIKGTEAVATIDEVFENGFIMYLFDTPLADGTDGGACGASHMTDLKGNAIVHPKSLATSDFSPSKA